SRWCMSKTAARVISPHWSGRSVRRATSLKTVSRIKEEIAGLRLQMRDRGQACPHRQISLTDPDTRSMATARGALLQCCTSGKGSVVQRLLDNVRKAAIPVAFDVD